MFTQKDFDDKDSALTHYKKAGEQMRLTRQTDKSSQQAETDRIHG
jgi:hypothetical protein